MSNVSNQSATCHAGSRWAWLALSVLVVGCQPSQTTTVPTFPQLRITTTSLPNGVVGVAYGADVEAVGGNAVYSWSVIDGALPDGLSLGTGNGVITGTPTTAGGSSFMVQVNSGDGQQATAQLVITVVQPSAHAEPQP